MGVNRERVILVIKVSKNKPAEDIAAAIDFRFPKILLMKIIRTKREVQVTVKETDKRFMINELSTLDFVENVIAE